MDNEVHDHDRGLAFDLSTLLTRRRAMLLVAGAGLATIAGCGTGSDGTSAASTSTSTSTSTSGSGSTATTAAEAAACQVIPEETAGPFPGDGSNGPNVLTESGIVRSDIRSSFGSSSTTAEGVPLTIAFTVVDVAAGCSPKAGAAVYAWHCDRDGQYSLYSPAVTGENYLRGVQETGSDGTATFTSIFPAAYSGRWPHIHFEVYDSLAAATGGGAKLRTSQIALPEDACDLVYGTAGYEQSVANLAQTSLDTDMVFADGWSLQLGTVSGSIDAGMTVALTVPV